MMEITNNNGTTTVKIMAGEEKVSNKHFVAHLIELD
jgi:hypothetical protein